MSNGQFFSSLVRLYHATFDRQAESAGVGHWASQLASGEMSFNDVAESFIASEEFQQTYGELDNEAFVSLLYENVLGREADEDGLAHWLEILESGAGLRSEILTGFSESDEFIEDTETQVEEEVEALSAELGESDDETESDDDEETEPDDDDETESDDDEETEPDDDEEHEDSDTPDEADHDISGGQFHSALVRLYHTAFNREADNQGVGYWTSVLAKGEMSFLEVAESFMASEEFHETYGELDNEAFIELLYLNVLKRDADEEGMAYWLEKLESGDSLRHEILTGFSESDELIDDDEFEDEDEGENESNTEDTLSSEVTEAFGDYVERAHNDLFEHEDEELGTWLTELTEEHFDFSEISEQFIASDEFSAINGEQLLIELALSTEEFVELLDEYQEVFVDEVELIGTASTGTPEDSSPLV